MFCVFVIILSMLCVFVIILSMLCVFVIILSMLCVFVIILSHASTIKRTKGLKSLKFRAVIGRFQVTSWL